MCWVPMLMIWSLKYDKAMKVALPVPKKRMWKNMKDENLFKVGLYKLYIEYLFEIIAE